MRIELSLWEKVFGLIGNRTIPRSAVTAVVLENPPLGATRGLGVPGSVKIGTWHGKGRKMFVRIRRSTPAVRIEANDLDRDAFLVSVSEASEVVTALSDGVSDDLTIGSGLRRWQSSPVRRPPEGFDSLDSQSR